MNKRETGVPESSLDTAERLERAGIPNVEMAFDIHEEKDIEGQPIDARIAWLRIKAPEGEEFADIESIEGKLYLPLQDANGELILFTPGFPGGNAGRFEQRYAKTFVENGYAFYTLRHNGTSLTSGEVSEEIINSPRRVEMAQEAGEQHLGGTREEGYRPDQIINEPIAPLVALSGKFDKIHLMGQSMGVASSYNALRRLKNHPEITDKVGNVVGIAGYIGGTTEREEKLWDGMKMPIKELIEYEMDYVEQVGLNFKLDAKEFEESLKKVAEANEQMKVPEHVGNVLVYTPDDPLIAGPGQSEQDSVEQYGPSTKRKIVIRDESNLNASKPHSMLWIKPENLVRAVEAKVSKGLHYIKVPNTATDAEGRKGMLQKG